jgi:hypothetical protein
MSLYCRLLLLVLLVPGCVVTTDDDLWKDFGTDPDSKTAETSIIKDTGPREAAVDQRPAVDGPRKDGPPPKKDGPPPKEASIEASAPDLPGHEGKSPLGTACSAAGQCQSNHCVDNVCCASDCSSPCTSCNLSGKEGTCTADPAGTDPGNNCAKDPVTSCKLDGTCDGMGGCRSYVSGTVCGSACVSTDSSADKTCDGSGQCQTPSGSGTSCGVYLCNLSTGACYTSCTSDAQCKTSCNPAGKCK